MIKATEKTSKYDHLESMSTDTLIRLMHRENQFVQEAMNRALPQITALAEAIYQKMERGGRLFYLGAGTSGRLGIVDASECPPTFGVPHDWVIGLIAGGDSAIRKSVEHAEDDTELAWKNLQDYQIDSMDFVVGIAASGTTPYVLGGLKHSNKAGIETGCIVCNYQSPAAALADYPVEVVTGPEFVTGSTRLKAGTAQKLVLNMLTTSVMIKLGRVQGNRMVDMQLSNHKLVERGVKMIMECSELHYEAAKDLLIREGSVRAALDSLH